jgi:hypothetical protein
MKFLVTHRAPQLGAPGSTIDLTPSKAAYERLRGHVVELVEAKDSPAEEALEQPRKRGR